MAYQNDSDDEGFMCFGCGLNPFKCGCADTSLRGNVPLPVAEIKPPVFAPLQVAAMGPINYSPVRRGAVKCHDEETESESESDSEGLTQPYYPANQGVAAIEEPDTEEEPMADEPDNYGGNDSDEDFAPPAAETVAPPAAEIVAPPAAEIVAPPAAETVVPPAASWPPAASSSSATPDDFKKRKRVSQNTVEEVKAKIKGSIVQHGPVSFDEILAINADALSDLYGKPAAGRLVVRNYLSNRKMGWLKFDGEKYSYDPAGVDERPVVTKETIVELSKDGTACYSLYPAACAYLEHLKPHLKKKTAACSLHAALRQNNGKNGRVYEFVADAVKTVPAGASLFTTLQQFIDFFNPSPAVDWQWKLI